MSDREPERESSFDIPTSGLPGEHHDVEYMLARDGKLLGDPERICYATARADRKAPKFPGVSGNLRGTASR